VPLVQEGGRHRRRISLRRPSPQEAEGAVDQHPARSPDDQARGTTIVVSRRVVRKIGQYTFAAWVRQPFPNF